MKIGHIDLDTDVLVVAEIGNNHEGDPALAAEMVRRAAASGAGAVKFQTFHTEQYVRPSDADRFARLKGFELTRDAFVDLAALAGREGVLFISTPFDLDSAAFLSEIASAIKISSGDNTFWPLIRAAAEGGKPMLMSCGIASLAEIGEARALVERTWDASGVAQELALLHCVCAYPVPPEQANLAAIGRLREEFGCTVGYSDHTLGIEAAALSVAAGARIVEKHFTLDKHHSDFRDHQLSADPEEMTALVRRIREVETLLGDGAKTLRPCERDLVVAVRRSIVARRDLPAGACLGWDDITWVRPGGGVAPGCEQDVLGRRLNQSLRSGQAVTADVLET